MKTLFPAVLRLLLAAVLTTAFAGAAIAAAGATPPRVVLMKVDGAIQPSSADYLVRGIAHAQAEHAALAIIALDTPGGLDLSMRRIIKAILQSSVPVATYVSPGGARAASAGTYILYASHVAAMAPGTNLGAATPVRLGGSTDSKDGGSPMQHKQVNDASAYIRGLAQLRGRNEEWAEQAVREAVSLSASEALRQNVIDFIAEDVPGLLRQADGREVIVKGQKQTLHVRNAQVEHYDPDWRTRLLSVIADPSVALLLMTIGVWGLILEFFHPGTGVPGVVGGIALVLGLYALQLLPVNFAGLALIVLGLGFMVAEAFVPSFGVLGLGGIASFIGGAVILIDTEQPGFGIPLGFIAAVAAASAFVIVGAASMALRARRRPQVSGEGRLIGMVGEIVEVGAAHTWAHVDGENWQVVSRFPLRQGEKVRVLARKGLVLEVGPAPPDAITT